MYREPIFYRAIQRDARTSLGFKNMLLWIPAISMFCIMVSCTMMFALYSDGAQEWQSATAWTVYAAIVLAIALICFMVNIIAILSPRYMWMTDIVAGGRCIGKDVEDCNPFVLQRNAAEIQRHFETDYARFQNEIQAIESRRDDVNRQNLALQLSSNRKLFF